MQASALLAGGGSRRIFNVSVPPGSTQTLCFHETVTLRKNVRTLGPIRLEFQFHIKLQKEVSILFGSRKIGNRFVVGRPQVMHSVT